MQNFFAFFFFLPAPILLIAMVENTNANNFWYHIGFGVFLLVIACIRGCMEDSRSY